MTDLRGANLRTANLIGANLEFTNLTDCRTEGMSVFLVDFTKHKNLTQDQVNASFGVKLGWGLTLLPDHLSYPDHWYDDESVAEADPQTAFQEFCDTWSLGEIHGSILIGLNRCSLPKK